MKHDNIENLIQKYLDREIDSREDDLLHTHLATCAECRSHYEDMVRLHDALQGLPDLQPHPGFNARVLAHIGMKRIHAWVRAAIASMVLSAIVFVALVFSPLTTGWLPRALLTLPAVLRFFDKVRFIISTVGQTFEPFLRNLVNPFYPVVGILLSILIMYLLSKVLLQKEAPCKA